jgi:DNA-binding transcriptional LysR family regulator
MELRQLRQFVAVAEHLHFGRAAAALAMAQPPLSRAIRLLEEELGATLFVRNRRRVALADAGRALLPEARSLIAGAARVAEVVRGAARGEHGHLALAFVSIVDYTFLPDLLRRFTARYPGVRVDLREATTDVQQAELRAGRIDAGILLGPPAEGAASALDYRALAREPMVLALPTGHPAARGGAVALKRLAAEAMVSFPRAIAPRLHDAIVSACAEAGFSPRIVQEAIQMQTIISLVSAGMGVAIVPGSVQALRRKGVSYRRLRGGIAPLEIGLAWRRGADSAALARFVEMATIAASART